MTSPIRESLPNPRSHSNTIDKKPKMGAGLEMSKTAEKSKLESKIQPFKMKDDRKDGVVSDNGQITTDFQESLKE